MPGQEVLGQFSGKGGRGQIPGQVGINTIPSEDQLPGQGVLSQTFGQEGLANGNGSVLCFHLSELIFIRIYI